jgi:hypothetical protein
MLNVVACDVSASFVVLTLQDRLVHQDTSMSSTLDLDTCAGRV